METTPVAGGFSVTASEGLNGQSYAVLTGCNETVTGDTTAAGPAVFVHLKHRYRDKSQQLTVQIDQKPKEFSLNHHIDLLRFSIMDDKAIYD